MMHRQGTRDSCGAARQQKSEAACRSMPLAKSRQSSSSSSSRRTPALSSSTNSIIVDSSNNRCEAIVSSSLNIRRSIIARSSRRCSSRQSTQQPQQCSQSAWQSCSSGSLLSVLAWSMTLLLVSSCLGIADAGALMGHPFSKRSFMDIQCKGVYDKSLFARLDRICEDCYNLFREPQLHTLCRKNCFTSDYFKGCLDVLLLQDEMEWIQTSIKQLHGADPGV